MVLTITTLCAKKKTNQKSQEKKNKKEKEKKEFAAAEKKVKRPKPKGTVRKRIRNSGRAVKAFVRLGAVLGC